MAVKRASRMEAGAKKQRNPAPRMLPRARVAAAVQRMAAPKGGDRFEAGKALWVTADKDPGRVYPHFDAIAALLASNSKIVRWNALQIIACLAAVDTARKLDTCLDAYLAFITGGNLISAANAIGGAARIARSRPDLQERMIAAILQVEDATYETAECRNVATGKVLEVLQELGPNVCRRREVAAFVRRQQTNPRAAVARRAKSMLAELTPDA